METFTTYTAEEYTIPSDNADLARDLVDAGPWPDHQFDDASQLTDLQSGLLARYKALPRAEQLVVRIYISSVIAKDSALVAGEGPTDDREWKKLISTTIYLHAVPSLLKAAPASEEEPAADSGEETDEMKEQSAVIAILEAAVATGLAVAFLAGIATHALYVRSQYRRLVRR